MVKAFEEIRKEDVLSAGGKGANLGEMVSAGIAIPPGFIVTADAYRQFLKDNGLDELFFQTLKDAGNDRNKLHSAAKLFRKKILAGKLSSALTREITKAYERLAAGCGSGNLSVAVRSSATAEDLPDASFAGQQETYLNISGIQTILKQILSCYASLWGDRAVFYRQSQGYAQNEAALAVVIQEMIESEIAGVLFTVNPITQNQNEIQINASYGLGESVVSGRVTPDSYLCNKNGTLLQVTIGQKDTELLYDETGTKEAAVSKERQRKQALSDTAIQALCAQALRIERHYGYPMDIEWAISRGNIFILQARAVTTLNVNTENPEEETLIESYLKECKVSGLTKKRLLFLLEKIPDAFYPFDSDMTAAISSQLTAVFSSFGMIMSAQPDVDDDGIETLPSNGFKITKNIVNIFKTLKLMRNFDYCHQILEQQMQDFTIELSRITALPIDQMGLAECGKSMEDISDYVRRLSYLRFYYSLFPIFLAVHRYEKAVKKINPSYSGFDLLQNLNNRTAELARNVAVLSQRIKKQPELAQAIISGTDYQGICSRFPDIVPAFNAFFSKFGYSSDFNCYCLHAKSFKEEPNRLLHIIRPLLSSKEITAGAEQYTKIMAQMREHYGGTSLEKLEKDINHLRYFHIVREESQYMWETAFYFMRRILARTALISTGDADYFNNLAYLFLNEVLALCKRGELSELDKETISRRKKKRPLAQKVWERAKLRVLSGNWEVLKGIGGSTGVAVGKVCVVNGPEEFYKLKKGEILVCRLTDPEYTPLFALASAVVTDTGASLSHAAIVAREYHVPAVLGVGAATARFHDGDLIRVDGTKGEVAAISSAPLWRLQGDCREGSWEKK